MRSTTLVMKLLFPDLSVDYIFKIGNKKYAVFTSGSNNPKQPWTGRVREPLICNKCKRRNFSATAILTERRKKMWHFGCFVRVSEITDIEEADALFF